VSLGEDACRVRQAAQPLTTRRNLVLGLYELREWRPGRECLAPGGRRPMPARRVPAGAKPRVLTTQRPHQVPLR
jgi:hypothetical protein